VSIVQQLRQIADIDRRIGLKCGIAMMTTLSMLTSAPFSLQALKFADTFEMIFSFCEPGLWHNDEVLDRLLSVVTPTTLTDTNHPLFTLSTLKGCRYDDCRP
jgi:hypothetical protein